MSNGTTGNLQTTSEGRGKSGRRAPELIRRDENEKFRFTKTSDIWSLGCILYELCCGKKPFRDDWEISRFADADTLINFRDWFNDDQFSSRIFRTWISQMLEVDWQKRPSASSFGQRFTELLSTLNYEWNVVRSESDPKNFCKREYLLGTDLPKKIDVVRWEDVVQTDNVEENSIMIEQYKTLVDVRELLLGAKHPIARRTLVCYAWKVFYAGQTLDAAAMFKKAIRGIKKVKGGMDNEMLSILEGQAWTLINLGCYKKASEQFKELCRVTSKSKRYGPKHLSNMMGLAKTRIYQSKSRPAINLLKRILLIQKSSDKPSLKQLETLECMSFLARAYFDHGQIEDAARLYSQISKLQTKILHNKHPDTLVSQSGLAWTHLELGQLQEAIQIWEGNGVLAAQMRTVGADHEHTIASRKGLAQAYKALGQTEKAIQFL